MNKKHALVGIDWSMTSPSICVCLGEFSFSNCSFYFFSKTKKQKSIDQKNLNHYEYPEYTSPEERYEYLSEWALSIIPDGASIYMEDYAFNAQGLVFNIAECTGVLKHKMYKRGMTYEPVSPTVVKKLATGKGNSSKDQVIKSFIAENGSVLECLGKGMNPLSDIIDSYYVCKYGKLKI